MDFWINVLKWIANPSIVWIATGVFVITSYWKYLIWKGDSKARLAILEIREKAVSGVMTEKLAQTIIKEEAPSKLLFRILEKFGKESESFVKFTSIIIRALVSIIAIVSLTIMLAYWINHINTTSQAKSELATVEWAFDLVAKGRDAEEAGEVAKAIEHISGIEKRFKSRSVVQYLADLQAKHAQFSHALDNYRYIESSLGGPSFETKIGIATCLTELKEWGEAEKALEAAADLAGRGGTATTTNKSFMISLNYGNLFLRQAVALPKDSADRARLLEKVDEHLSTAEAQSRTAVPSQLSKLHANRGTYYQALGMYVEAEREYRQQLDSEESLLRVEYGHALLNVGIALRYQDEMTKDEEATGYLATARDILGRNNDPAASNAALVLGLAYIDIGELDNALASLKEAVQLASDDLTKNSLVFERATREVKSLEAYLQSQR